MPTTFRTFTELVLERTAAHSAKDAFVYLPDGTGGSGPEHLTYARLDDEARRTAAWLQEHGASGRQVLLLYPTGTAFIKAFTGCLYAGSVAVPAPLPTEQGQHFSRVSGILRDSEARAVLTDSANAPAISEWLAAEGMTDVLCLATDSGDFADPAAYREPGIDPESLAFLQYTSGSTSDPKGVMVSHRNLLANEETIHRVVRSHSDSTIGGWLPFYHDMGLIGHILHPLYMGARGVLMSPVSFLKRPHRWLEMIGEYGVEIGGGPNFAYELCLRRVSDEQLAGLDLSRWESAVNGAEPIRAETVRAFTERFAAAGFRPETFFPCYGMAETTLLVSGAPRGTRPVLRDVDAAGLEGGEVAPVQAGEASRTLVSSGACDHFELRIVDPETRRERPAGSVGEIWLKGESVATGYWKNPGTNKEIFDAAIEGGAPRGGPDGGGQDGGGWLRTGDLGAVDGGELFVTGRLKELIIFSGRNLYPQDVERVAQTGEKALNAGSGAVFSVESDREHLVVVQEVRPSALTEDLPTVAGGIQRRVSREFNVPAGNVVLVRPGTVRKTTSGKIQRTLMRKLFLEGALTPLHEVLEPAVRELAARTADRSPAPVV